MLLVFGDTVFGQQEHARASTVHAARQVSCYPNPATSRIQFDLRNKPSLESAQLKVFNFLGKKVVDIPQFNATVKIDLTSFTRGIYIYQLTDARGRLLECGKFQVERP